MAWLKLQSAMEYLMTYGWAILLIAIVAGVIFGSGLLNPASATSSFCSLEAGFSCEQYYMYANGILSVSVLQTTSGPLTVTAIGCNTNATQITTANVPATTLQIDQNSTFDVQCMAGGSQFSGSIGQLFTGHLQINYTDITTGFPQTVFGSVSVKIAR